jgi:hypothetical protein
MNAFGWTWTDLMMTPAHVVRELLLVRYVQTKVEESVAEQQKEASRFGRRG